MKLKLITFLVALLSATSLFANFTERVELMKYVISEEALHPVQTEWEEVSFFQKIKLIEEAHAYKEGDTCLILGFKSKYINGMCRLSKAEDIKNYKAQCSPGTLPCNPHVFGKPSQDKPFCVTPNSGNELSKYCAHKAMSHLSQKSKSPLLKGVEKVSPKKFDINAINLSKIDPALAKEVDSLFGAKDSSVQAAVTFMKGLCADLKAEKASKMQRLDIDNCHSYLSLLEKSQQQDNRPAELDSKRFKVSANTEPATTAKVNFSKVEMEKKPSVIKAIGQQVTISTGTPIKEAAIKKPELVCAQEDASPLQTVLQNVADVKKITAHSEPERFYKCLEQLDTHPSIKWQLEQEAAMDAEMEQDFKNWHNLGGEKKYALFCYRRYQNIDKTVPRYVFLSPDRMDQVISDQALNITMKFSLNGKAYYADRDHGSQLDINAVDKISSALAHPKWYAQLHEKTKPNTLPVTKVPPQDMDYARECLVDRIEDNLKKIYEKEIFKMPGVNDYNKDVAIYNSQGPSSPELQRKYARTVAEITDDFSAKIKRDLPACESLVTGENVMNYLGKYDTDKRIKLYEKMRALVIK